MDKYVGGIHLESVHLPLGAPLSKAYSHNAYQLSILASKEETKPWILMNYIQLISEIDNYDNPILFHLPGFMGDNWCCFTPWFDCSSVSRDIVDQCSIDFSALIKTAIINNNYVFLYVNEKYIPGTVWNSKGMDFNHNLLLHGYDESLKEVTFLIYDSSRRLVERNIHISELEKAFYDNKVDNERNENRVVFIRLLDDPKINVEFDLSNVIEQLINYRDEMPVDKMNIGKNYNFGLGVYDSLIHILNNICDESVLKIQERIIIPLHLLLEHKTMMIERLRFIGELYPRITLHTFIEEFKYVKRSFESLRNNMLKFEFTSDLSIITKVIRGMRELKEKERTLITKLIYFLKSR